MPSFPQDVATFYKWPSILIDSPDGCTICHLDNTGGAQSFRPFGRLLSMQPFSVMDDTTLKAALTLLPMSEPLLADDLMAGMDPNGDVGKNMSMLADGGSTGVAAAAGPMDPVPSYGCDIGMAGHDPSGAFALGEVALLMGVGMIVRRRRRALRPPNQV